MSITEPDSRRVRNVPPMISPQRVMIPPDLIRESRMAMSFDMPLTLPSLMRVVSRMS